MSTPLKNVYYDMLNRKASLEQDHVSHRVFVLCKSCFWCASILYDDGRPFRICPICMNYELEFMPLSIDENYKFDYDKRHGVTLEFIQRDRTPEVDARLSNLPQCIDIVISSRNWARVKRKSNP